MLKKQTDVLNYLIRGGGDPSRYRVTSDFSHTMRYHRFSAKAVDTLRRRHLLVFASVIVRSAKKLSKRFQQ